ncbi:MAG TPA: YceI family protein [Streptosporangiaceae bacterium]|jgi:polyisoprenoid-binding protein YceI|nr:YceI family protein [Streptosporangiaceae bacterium]
MPAPSGQLATAGWQARLKAGSLTGDWTLDPRQSSIRLTSKLMGLARVSGVFGEVSGTAAVGPDGAISGTVTVAAASIDTRNPRRDRHLRSADFFDSEYHPDLTFSTDTVRLSGQGATVTGALTVRGVTRPLSFEAVLSGRGDDEAGLDAEFRINRADFGLSWNVLGLASMMATVTIHATFSATER